MEQKEPTTFEEIDAHITASLVAVSPGGKFHMSVQAMQANPAAAIPNVCASYKMIRPVLKALLLIPFLKASWKTAIQTFISFMDGLCP